MAVRKPGTSKTAEDIFGTNPTSGATSSTVSASSDFFGLSFFLQDTVNEEYLERFVETIAPIFKEPKNVGSITITNNIIKASKSNIIYKGLPYSYVILATKASDSDKIYAHLIMLEATGNPPKTAKQMIDGVMMKNPAALITSSDLVLKITNPRYLNVIAEELKTTADKIEITNGTIIPYHVKPEDIAQRVAIIAYNTNIARYVLGTGKVPLVNAGNIARNYNQIKMDIFHNVGITINEVGRVIREDYKLDVKGIRRDQDAIRGIDDEFIEDMLNSVGGYLEYMPIREVVNGMEFKKIKPIVIANVFQSPRLGMDFNLLALANLGVFGNPGHLLSLLLNVPRELGALNFLTNLKGEKTGFGKKLKLRDPKYDDNTRIELLSKMFQLDPLIYVEVDLFGPNYDSAMPFAALGAAKTDPKTAAEANEYIIRIAEEITGTKFVNRQVALDPGIIVPVGRFVDKDGVERDVREFDLAKVCELANGVEIVTKWVESNISGATNNFLSKIEVMTQLGVDPEITGKAVRIPINPAFYVELIGNLMKVGYKPAIESAGINVITYNDLFTSTAAYANAGVGNITFGQPMYAGNQMYTPGFNFGFGGW